MKGWSGPATRSLAQIDVDPRNAGWVYPVDLAITGDVGDVLAMLAELGLSGARARARTAAGRRGRRATAISIFRTCPRRRAPLHHSDVVRGLQAFLGPDDLLALDAGANRIWATFGLRMPLSRAASGSRRHRRHGLGRPRGGGGQAGPARVGGSPVLPATAAS